MSTRMQTHTRTGGCRQDDIEREIEPNDSPRIRTEADDDANDEWAKDEGNA